MPILEEASKRIFEELKAGGKGLPIDSLPPDEAARFAKPISRLNEAVRPLAYAITPYRTRDALLYAWVKQLREHVKAYKSALDDYQYLRLNKKDALERLDRAAGWVIYFALTDLLKLPDWELRRLRTDPKDCDGIHYVLYTRCRDVLRPYLVDRSIKEFEAGDIAQALVDQVIGECFSPSGVVVYVPEPDCREGVRCLLQLGVEVDPDILVQYPDLIAEFGS